MYHIAPTTSAPALLVQESPFGGPPPGPSQSSWENPETFTTTASRLKAYSMTPGALGRPKRIVDTDRHAGFIQRDRLNTSTGNQ